MGPIDEIASCCSVLHVVVADGGACILRCCPAHTQAVNIEAVTVGESGLLGVSFSSVRVMVTAMVALPPLPSCTRTVTE